MDDIFNITSSDITDGRSESSNSTGSFDQGPEIEMNDEFVRCFNMMNDTADHIFMTGDAGTGKSTLIKYFAKHTKKRVVLLAPTGVAAVNIGGQTIHSFFKFPPKPMSASNIPQIIDQIRPLYQRIDAIIIEEVSMVRADLMDAIDMFLRFNLYSDDPFAGKQIIMVGDLNQLPPVVGSLAEREMLADKYDSPFFFDANVFKNIGFEKIRLTKIYRQKDGKFIDLLNKIKHKKINQADIDEMNKATVKTLTRNDYNDLVTLCATNSIADHINGMMLNRIDEEEHVLEGQINGYFDPKHCPVDEKISVKVGCKIMMLNNDSIRRWHNGTVGKLLAVYPTHLDVEIDGIPHKVEKIEYESRKYVYDNKKQDVESVANGTFIQFPIRLAYALTVHKSQGKTFNRINIDMGNGGFAHGMVYVAFSRCRTLEGITQTRALRMDDIIYDPKVFKFMESIKTEIQ